MQRPNTMLRLTRGGALAALLTGTAWGGNDASIQGALRERIQASMRSFITDATIGGTYRLYDPVEGKLVVLELDTLHSGIVRKGAFFVSCADFVDEAGRKLDLDFLVIDDNGTLRTTQAIVHAVDGTKRDYHLETTD